MTAHTCRTITPGCYRCELGRDEMAAIEAEIETEARAAWIKYRDEKVGRNVDRRQLRRRDFIAGYKAGAF